MNMQTPDELSLAIVTVSMNRTDHVLESAKAISTCPYHTEHVIVDWSSEPALALTDLPNDSRIRLIRVSRESRWSASRAYNFGFSHCSADIVLKLDADQIVSEAFFEANPISQREFRVNDLSVGDTFFQSSTGVLFCPRDVFWKVGGFNEYLYGWGYEDIDLFSRLRGYISQSTVATKGLSVIGHSDVRRVRQAPKHLPAYALKQENHELNKWLATACVWNRDIQASCYRHDGDAYIAEFVPDVPRYLSVKSDYMVKKLTLNKLSHVLLEPSSPQRLIRTYESLMTAKTYPMLRAISWLPRAYARLVNKWLRM